MFEVSDEQWDARETRILDFWQQERIFERSLEQRSGQPLFATYDGPPFATGLPHYGHLLTGTIKDAILRYKSMCGYYVPRRFGWDCHGLPVENEVEKAHGLSGAASIEAFGIARFNEACRSIVHRYTEEWKSVVLRTGRWVDFRHTYRTMDLPFMESVWWVFHELYEKGLIYEGFRVMPYSAKLGTTLSNFEAGENYKEVEDPALTIALPLESDPNCFLLIWTTTPWTLVSNLAVLVGPDLMYCKVHDRESGHYYYVLDNRYSALFGTEERYSKESTSLGKDLVGLHYRPPFDYFLPLREEGAFRVIEEESVNLEEGTGLVHAAPAFGEVDFYACQRASIPRSGIPVCPVDANGRFTKEIPEYQGIFVKEADRHLIARLKGKGLLWRQEVCRHRYPFCWRSDTPLIYKAVSTWFLSVERIKEALLAANREIHWVPDYIKEGRFGKWLESARDWNISRSRYWSTPIPLWRSQEGDLLAVGSLKQLEELTKSSIHDLHRHFIDSLEIEQNGKRYRRIPEVFDCWFESGSMPYAQDHFPFENQELFKASFPADFIAEGLDQTRGWFYTLTVLAAALYQRPAFKNVIVNGIILAENGAKMSKRLRNYPDPQQLIDQFGADAVRLYMLDSPASRAEPLCFAPSGVSLMLRQFLIPWWNSYSFLATYAKIAPWEPETRDPPPARPSSLIDRWILARLNTFLREIGSALDDYELSRAVATLIPFVDALTNWYIRRCRRRFWGSEDTLDRREAFSTLYYVLVQLCRAAAPFAPFLSEAIYRELMEPSTEKSPVSVHLCNFPKESPLHDDPALEQGMEGVRLAVSLGHALRKEHKLKVRQPLSTFYIATRESSWLSFAEEQRDIIAEELNVKNVEFVSSEERFVLLTAKPNFRVLGKKLGPHMRKAQAAIESLSQESLASLLSGQSIPLSLGDLEHSLAPDEVELYRTIRPEVIASTSGPLTVALDMTLNEELLLEGLAREVINKVNTMRREAGLAVTDRIHLTLAVTERLRQALQLHGDYVWEEVLAKEVDLQPFTEQADVIWELNGEPTGISFQKIP